MNLQEKLDSLDDIQREIEGLRPIDAEQEGRVMAKFRLDWNYNSNAIEGNTLSIGETAALLSYGLTAKGKPLKDHLDIEGHNAVLDVLGDVVRTKEPVTEHLIRSLHQVMLGADREVSSVNDDGLRVTRTIAAGRYKTSVNQLVTQTGQTRRFALPSETPALMSQLVATANEERQAPTMHPVLFAASFHHQFVSIHPFDDGNGRIARILMNLLLMQHGYLPAILRLAERNEYLAALVQADAGELGALFELITDACMRSSELYLRAARGGPVDDLQDFDKQLALLTQSALAERLSGDGKEGTPSDHLQVVDTLLVPMFESVTKRLETLRPLFAGVLLHLEGRFTPEGLILKPSLEEYRAVVVPALASGVRALTEARLFFQGNSYVGDSSKTFVVSVKCSFHARHYAIQAMGYLQAAQEIFRATYDEAITSAEVDAVSRSALEIVVKAVERLIAKN
ncbi:Fic family protein [Variovorax sp. JS1663]|uniref:Fic family protein n=1 Tax=Variovorax sp. JS1663 TaxID=1851577 RepID=UPI000B346EAE|nr:Fic family protein [Variovorax sp. JS1663]OUL99643.1 hypothetical protein A8M77_25115 [Variovorax sp. JS1663]